jgi:hypothetical protein
MIRKVLIFVLFLILTLSLTASALHVETGKKIYVAKDQIIFDNFFVAAEKVHIAGRVMGDLIVFGGEVIITGDVDGNIITAAGELRISGKANNIIGVGGEVLLSGVTKKDLLMGGGEIYISKNARIGRDAYLGSGSTNIAGSIFRNLRVGSGSIVVAPSSMIKGKIDYSSRYANISNQAKVLGSISAHEMPDYEKKASALFSGFLMTQQIIGIITMLLLGILIIVYLPNQVTMIAAAMKKEFLKSLGLGLLSLIVIPLLVIILFITLVGFPIGVLLLVAYIFGIYITTVFVSIVIGKWIFEKIKRPTMHPIVALFLGYLILKLLTWVPLIGWLFGLIVFLWAFGAIISTRFVTYKEAREKGVL